MKIIFEKYHGTGNDFIIIDDRKGNIKLRKEDIFLLCHRKFGIGADGLMLLQRSEMHDFKMTYYNADGNEGTMCGNGGRCIVHFAKQKGMIDSKSGFEAIDGVHQANVLSYAEHGGTISLKMADVGKIEKYGDDYFLNTGSPHYVKIVENIDSIDIYEEGKNIRWDSRFQPQGTNADFVMVNDDHIVVRTFERGVENLTLSCGTGVVASAIAAAESSARMFGSYHIKTDGGDLEVRFKKDNRIYKDIWLEGPVVKVYEGIVEH